MNSTKNRKQFPQARPLSIDEGLNLVVLQWHSPKPEPEGCVQASRLAAELAWPRGDRGPAMAVLIKRSQLPLPARPLVASLSGAHRAWRL